MVDPNLGIANEIALAPSVPALAYELHIQLQRYIEAQYPIRHATVVAERKALLETAKVISQEPFIESMPGYRRGKQYSELPLAQDIRDALAELAKKDSIIPAFPYHHQTEALEAFLAKDQDLIVITGTGSGKTETFLLPILVRSLQEARNRASSFQMPGMRTLLLYPMNALVNDQLTRLRRLFGNSHLVSWFQQRYSAKRSVRFGMYTSRTPYPGMMSKDKNIQRLIPLLEHYLRLEAEQVKQVHKLKAHGRWPTLSLTSLQEAASAGKITVTDNDYELYIRHQMQQWCPDILITNYSMLEYMLMRPIEHSIFQQTADWLAGDNDNTLLIVLDEAHLYSGVTGTEISLLLRRLQARLGITRERVRYILTSASLDTGSEGQKAILEFATNLVGIRKQHYPGFAIIQGQRIDAPVTIAQHKNILDTDGEDREAIPLYKFDLNSFSSRATNPVAGRAAIAALAEQLDWVPPLPSEDLSRYLGEYLPRLYVFRQLWKLTSGHAQAFETLAQQLFPTLQEPAYSKATSALLALAAAATTSENVSLLPVRTHVFFRGLPPLYACINPHCSARRVSSSPAELGTLWLSPRLHCACGARVYELYGHRNCGAIFLRAFAPTEAADFYWHEPGKDGKPESRNNTETFLLIGQPHPKTNSIEQIHLHTMTGRVVSQRRPLSHLLDDQEKETILVYRPTQTAAHKKKKMVPNETLDEKSEFSPRQWKSCPVCLKRLNESSITGLSTKGEQPFVNLIRRQFELQTPNKPAEDNAPNMGRKVLLFSDGRQRAARLARDLPREVELDTFRQALLLAVARRSRQKAQALICIDNALYCEFVAVCALHRLHFFDGNSQAALLRDIATLREYYASDADDAINDGWEPPIPQGYRQALLRQVADPFYSMQRMCAAVIEPRTTSLRLLRKKSLFTRLDESNLRALTIAWIEALLEESAFDMSISPTDRKNIVPGDGFSLISDNSKTEGWNEAEKAAESLLGYAKSQLHQLRTAFIDEFCETKDDFAFLKPEKLALRLTLEDSWYQCSDCAQLIWLPLKGRCPNPRCGSLRLVQLPGNDPSLHARTDFYREPIRQVVEEVRTPIHITAEEHTAQLSHRDAQQVSATTEQYELRFQDIGISSEQPAVDILSCTTTMEVGVDIGTLVGIGLRTMPPRRANYQQRAGRAGRRSTALSTVLAYSENGSHDAYYFEHPNEMISGALPCPQISRINQRLARRHIQAALIQTFFLEQVQFHSKMSERQYTYLSEALGTAQAFFSPSATYGLTRFGEWLATMLKGHTPHLAQHIAAWLPNALGEATLNEQQKCEFVRTVADEFLVELRHVGEQFKTLTNAKDQKEQFGFNDDDTTLLDLLFEHGFLPTYAFPREVRSFVIEEKKHSSNGAWRIGIKQRPQQSIDIALSEYAPGRELIVDKATYRIGGIYVDPFPGSTLANRVPSLFTHPQIIFALCFTCGYTHKEEIKTTTGNSSRFCPLCQTPLVIKEILDPPGFAPERGKDLEQRQMSTGTKQNSTATQVKLVLPLTDADDFAHSTTDGRIAWSYAEHRELLIVNGGMSESGFSICRSCGASAPGDPSWLQQAHDRPFLLPAWIAAPRKCYGTDGIWQGYLGHIFHSDLLLLRLLWPIGVAYQVGNHWMKDALDTIAQALLRSATRLLDIANSELQVGWSYTSAASSCTNAQTITPRMVDFFLFDTLAGGAGYATQLGRHIEALLIQTQQSLETCPDKCENSCYRCLRTYSNRILHQQLDRHLAGKLLQAIVSGKPPTMLTTAQQTAQLQMLQKFFELAGIESQWEVTLQGVSIPLLLKTAHESYAIGVYPVQQDRQIMKHALDALPKHQVRLFSDYDLAHNLPTIAQVLLQQQ